MKEALIDTDILSYFLKGEVEIAKRFREYLKAYPKINISIITLYEVMGGLEYKKAHKQMADFDQFLNHCEIFNISNQSARVSANIYGELKRKGRVVASADLLIAGIAIANGLCLITNNERHFKHLPGLELDNWKNPV
jgi:tRNA(fMet)-specific endonuclease VapC